MDDKGDCLALFELPSAVGPHSVIKSSPSLSSDELSQSVYADPTCQCVVAIPYKCSAPHSQAPEHAYR